MKNLSQPVPSPDSFLPWLAANLPPQTGMPSSAVPPRLAFLDEPEEEVAPQIEPVIPQSPWLTSSSQEDLPAQSWEDIPRSLAMLAESVTLTEGLRTPEIKKASCKPASRFGWLKKRIPGWRRKKRSQTAEPETQVALSEPLPDPVAESSVDSRTFTQELVSAPFLAFDFTKESASPAALSSFIETALQETISERLKAKTNLGKPRWLGGQRDRREPSDGLQILPSRRGQYKRKG